MFYHVVYLTVFEEIYISVLSTESCGNFRKRAVNTCVRAIATLTAETDLNPGPAASSNDY